MEKINRVLCLDFDDVIMRTKRVIEYVLEKIDARATEQYLMSVLQMGKNGYIGEEEKKELVDEHFDLKDRILEEVDNKYKGIIDYDKVINIGNAYNNAVEYINYLCNCGRYDQVYIVSHYNADREVEVKKRFIEKYIPKVKFIPVPFHKDLYEEGKKRNRTSKAQYVKEYLNRENIYHYTLIDDSSSNGIDWQNQGGIYIKFNPSGVTENVNEITDLQPINVMAMSEYTRLMDGNNSRKR